MGEQTWRPVPQPPCDPDCTCRVLNDTERWPEPPSGPVVIREPEVRECGVTGCTHCDPVARWIDDTDPAPVEPPPEPKPLPPVPESSYPPGAVDLPVQLAPPRWRRFIDSIRTTTRKA